MIAGRKNRRLFGFSLSNYEKLLMEIKELDEDELVLVAYSQEKNQFFSALPEEEIDLIEDCLRAIGEPYEEFLRARFAIGREYMTWQALSDKLGINLSRVGSFRRTAITRIRKEYRKRASYSIISRKEVLGILSQVDPKPQQAGRNKESRGKAGNDRLEVQYAVFKNSEINDDSFKRAILRPIHKLGWSVRLVNLLRANGIYLVGQSVMLPEDLGRIPKLGEKGRFELRKNLEKLGLKPGMILPEAFMAVIEAEADKYACR